MPFADRVADGNVSVFARLGLLSAELFGFSRTFDTAGEFPTAVDWLEHGQSGTRWEGKSAFSDAPTEFASSITFDDSGSQTCAAVFVFQGIPDGLGSEGDGLHQK
jgi:hypothetical protein